MRTIFIIISIMILQGCTVVPMTSKFPPVPDRLLTSCELLSPADSSMTSIVELLKVVVENYTKYHECHAKNDIWIEWYNEQKKIHDSLNAK